MELSSTSTQAKKIELDLEGLDSILGGDYSNQDSKSRVPDICQEIAEILERLDNEEKVSKE